MIPRTHSRFVMGIAFACVVFGSAAISMALDYEEPGLKPFPQEAFISPDVCGACHADIHGMWDGTMHSQAIADPLFIAASKRFPGEVSSPGEKADAEHCVSCHTPIGYRSGMIKGSSDDYGKVTGVAARSISCDLCHSINEVVALKNASFNTAPGKGDDDPGIKRGPRDDAESGFHESAFSPLHTSSRVCGSCHNVHHLSHLTRLEGTYDEWYHSPYNDIDEKQQVTCQDCHMHQAKGHPSTGMTERPDFPGKSALTGPNRPNIYRHSVVGGNMLIPTLLGHPEWAELASERLKHAAKLAVRGLDNGDGGIRTFTVRVTNAGAGHMLPTGVTEYRQMWLMVRITDASGATVMTSGIPGANGTLPPNTRLFATVFGDSTGAPTLNVARAAVLLSDHRVPPGGYVDEVFALPGTVRAPLTATVELRYRSLDPALGAALLGKPVDVPVVVMATVSGTLR